MLLCHVVYVAHTAITMVTPPQWKYFIRYP